MIYLHLKKKYIVWNQWLLKLQTTQPLEGLRPMNQSIRYVCTKPCLIILKSPEVINSWN